MINALPLFFPTVENECQNLTRTDAPLNGGLVCHWYTEQSSQFCQVMCNNGYDLPPETNAYETCGPTTEFIWSFKRTNGNNTLLPCVGEYAQVILLSCSLSQAELKTVQKAKYAASISGMNPVAIINETSFESNDIITSLYQTMSEVYVHTTH